MIWKASVAVALASMVAIACNDSTSPTAVAPQRNIVATNNNPENNVWGYYTPLDALFKELYERNNTLSRRGESDNSAASSTNLNLAWVFDDPGAVTLSYARSKLAAFIKDINNSLKSGKYSDCAAPQLIARAYQIDSTLAKVQAAGNTYDPSMLPAAANWDCDVSPLEFAAATGSATNGVTLTYNDPWHYFNDPANVGGPTLVYFEVQRWDPTILPSGDWVPVPQPQYGYESQTGPVVLTFTENLTTPGTYTYSARQCDYSHGGCSVWNEATVVVPDPNGGGGGEYSCVHDNRNGFMTKTNKTKDCPKADKIHPNINGNGH